MGNLYTEFEETVKYYNDNNVILDLYADEKLEEFRLLFESAYIGC
ncbi:hypothetical protein [Streptococcus sp.]